MKLNDRSVKNLAGVHPTLVRVVVRAAELAGAAGVEFVVTEGLRTRQRQAELVAGGASQTMNSKHLTGHAVDLAAMIAGQVRWDWPLYHKLAGLMKEAARELEVQIKWGGDWKSFPDGPHFEVDPAVYPMTP